MGPKQDSVETVTPGDIVRPVIRKKTLKAATEEDTLQTEGQGKGQQHLSL